MWRATDLNARLTRESIDLGNKEFIASHPPKLRLRWAEIEQPLLANHYPAARLYVANLGQSEAIIAMMGVDIFLRQTNARGTATAFNAQPASRPGTPNIPPGKAALINVRGNAPLTRDDIMNVTGRSWEMCLVAIINYTDPNGTERSASFFRIYDPTARRFYRAPAGDEYEEWDYED